MKNNLVLLALILSPIAYSIPTAVLYPCDKVQTTVAYASNNGQSIVKNYAPNNNFIGLCEYTGYVTNNNKKKNYITPMTTNSDLNNDYNEFNETFHIGSINSINPESPILADSLVQNYDYSEELLNIISLQTEYVPIRPIPSDMSFGYIRKFGLIDFYYKKIKHIQIELDSGAVLRIGEDADLKPGITIRIAALCPKTVSYYKDCRVKFSQLPQVTY